MSGERTLAVVVVSEAGCASGAAVAGALAADLYVPTRLPKAGPFFPAAGGVWEYEEAAGELIKKLFRSGHGLVLVMAVGAAVRFLSGLPRDKRVDPPVVVLDTAARYAVSLLSGHEGGANDLAYRVAAAVGAQPVVTTGSEGHRTLAAGLGCRYGVEAERILVALEKSLVLAGRKKAELRVIATAVFKAHEPGIRQACSVLGVSLQVFSREAVRSVEGLFAESKCARKYFDVGGVAEPCAFLAAHQGRIILPRLVVEEVTVALAEDRLWFAGSDRESRTI